MSLSKFFHPFEFMEHPQLEPEVKRAILASWASDASAVEGQPDLRRPAGASEPVRFDDIMSAMRTLDNREA
ncbi:hypothetical protein ACLIMP_22795 [Novosphingobium aerophilum]|uniref:hypothetical protein n=1 Tax=Novosphingobium aerophilum TaxID=2839843 RepID=UPI00163D571D